MAGRSETLQVPGVLRHRAVLGDWHPWLRDPIDAIRVSYLVGAIVLVFAGETSSAARLGATAAFVYLSRLIDPPRLFDLGFVLAMALQGWGNVFDLFERYGWYDIVVHLSLTLWFTPLFYIGLARLGVVPDLGEHREEHPLLGTWFIALAMGMAFGAGYEMYEWFVNNVIGGHLAASYSDTILDLAMNTLGAAAGGLLLAYWAGFGYGGSKRVPASKLGVSEQRSA